MSNTDSAFILFFGDLCPLEGWDTLTLDESWLQLTQEAKLVSVNLECPLTTACRAIPKSGPSLKADSKAIRLLQQMNVRLCNLANNHILDYGSQGLEDTLRALEHAGIASIGISRQGVESDHIVEIAGKHIGFTSFAENEFSTLDGYNPRAMGMNARMQHACISRLKSQADLVIVQYHGGVELHPYPTPQQQDYARFLVEMGADVVICHHSHVVSGFEIYQDHPIFYGLGNFYFPESGNPPEWYKGLGLKLSVEAILDFELVHLTYDAQQNKLYRTADSIELRDAMQQTNKIIGDRLELVSVWDAMCTKHLDSVLKTIYRPSKLHRAMFKLGLGRSRLMQKADKRLLNLIRCESHREKVLSMLTKLNYPDKNRNISGSD